MLSFHLGIKILFNEVPPLDHMDRPLEVRQMMKTRKLLKLLIGLDPVHPKLERAIFLIINHKTNTVSRGSEDFAGQHGAPSPAQCQLMAGDQVRHSCRNNDGEEYLLPVGTGGLGSPNHFFRDALYAGCRRKNNWLDRPWKLDGTSKVDTGIRP